MDQVKQIKAVLFSVCADDDSCKQTLANAIIKALDECPEGDSERPDKSGGSSDHEITLATIDKISQAKVEIPKCIVGIVGELFPDAKRSMSRNTEAELSTLLRKIKRMLQKQ